MRRQPADMAGRQFDVLVIGAGIHGACLAREAALRGLSVALVERGDFGAATSANSQKTIHGGLRYLQKLDLRRVRESARELRTLRRIAPHLVHPLPFVIPTSGWGRRSRSALAAALRLYDWMTREDPAFGDTRPQWAAGRVISRAAFLRLFPSFAGCQAFSGGALWYDAQAHNTERLTWAFVRSAAERGATVCNYAEVTGLLMRQRRVGGALVQDRLDGGEFEVHARVVVNAAGPWTRRIEELAGLGRGHPPLRLVRAWNVVTRELHPTHALGLPLAGRSARRDQPGRMVFMTPWRGRTIIGTVYAPAGADDVTRVSDQEVADLLDAVNQAYPGAELTLDDVLLCHHGLLPAGPNGGTGTDVLPAEHVQIIDHERRDRLGRMFSVVGVKYTTARRVAEKVVDVVCSRLNAGAATGDSARVAVDGGALESLERLEASLEKEAPARLRGALGRLVRTYGTRASEIIAHCRACPDDGEPLAADTAILRAEVRHAVRSEMAVKLADVVMRRSELGTRGRPGQTALRECARIMAEELGWSEHRVAQELSEMEESVWPEFRGARAAGQGAGRCADTEVTVGSNLRAVSHGARGGT